MALVEPQPGRRIFDPACGTAGFLISAYSHILRSHTKRADIARGIVDGSQLKPKQREFLEQHAFTGFDRAPRHPRHDTGKPPPLELFRLPLADH